MNTPLQQVVLRGELSTRQAVVDYITAGRATVTVRSTATGARLTFKFKGAKSELNDQGPNNRHARTFWVSVLRGPDNTSDYMFLGGIKEDGNGCWHVVGRSRSKVTDDAVSVKALHWMAAALSRPDDKFVAQAQWWHEGRCGRCGRKLTVPESINTGLGPECAGRVGR